MSFCPRSALPETLPPSALSLRPGGPQGASGRAVSQEAEPREAPGRRQKADASRIPCWERSLGAWKWVLP